LTLKNIPVSDRVKVYGVEHISRAVAVDGYVVAARVFGAGELRARPQTTIEEVPVICGSGKVKESGRRLTGVLLRDLLEEAGILIVEHDGPNMTYIVASGTDGYQALFSWHEIFNTPVGEGLLVSMEKDGKPLDEKEGELCLVSTRDERPGPRRIRYLSRVEVRRLVLPSPPVSDKSL
jgi:hypothetical protein